MYGPNRVKAVGDATLIGGTVASLLLFGPVGWAAIPVAYLTVGTAAVLVNRKVWEKDRARLKVYTSSADFDNLLEAAFVYNMVKHKIARIDHNTRIITVL